ncbi:hypothetical protein KEM54_001769 [Ascosphaera aggregata]|nr:hypothetical protein KEM54_001769 [Ascosphaera aggregata]
MSSFPQALGEKHHAFRRWSIERGVKINGIEAGVMPGQGMGIYAARDVKEDEIVLQVPLSAMLTIDSMPKDFVSMFADDAPVQGIMAAYLMSDMGKDDDDDDDRDAHDNVGAEQGVNYQCLRDMKPWLDILPSKSDIRKSMPLVWPENFKKWKHVANDSEASEPNKRRKISSPADGGVQDIPYDEAILLTPCVSGLWNTVPMLPPAVPAYCRSKHQDILARQENRLHRARDFVLAALPHIDWETFVYYWLIINTRCFYYDGNLSGAGDPRCRGKPIDDNDSIAMMPFADYFNHANEPGCKAQFDGKSYTFVTTRAHAKGEEIFVSYGKHPNDFLWAEYGFFLDVNASDVLYLDDIIINDLTLADLEELEGWQYLGNYQLFAGEVCYRTEMAACLKYMPRDHWRAYVYGGSTQSFDEMKIVRIIRDWIRKYLNESEAALKALESHKSVNARSQAGTASVDSPFHTDEMLDFRKDLCIKRWKQIKDLCTTALEAYNH